MSAPDLPDWLQEQLDDCPRTGGGVHSWLFNVARQLHWHYPDKEELADVLGEKVQGCGRDVPRREIQAAVRDSEAVQWRPGRSAEVRAVNEDENDDWLAKPVGKRLRQTPTPTGAGLNRIALDLTRLKRIVLEGPRLPNLRELSPFPCVVPQGKRMTKLLLKGLFDPGADFKLLCCGWSQSEFETKPLGEWVELSTMPFIVPNPMKKPWGYTKEGTMSAHTLDNTGSRRFLVVEMDFGLVERDGKTRKPSADFVEEMAALGISIADISAAVLNHLSEYAPLVLIVSSGGKSLHGWFYCQGQEEEQLLTFFRYAIGLGADWRMWLPSQFARMPDGTRDNGNRQAVHYFDPRPIFNFHQPNPGTFLTELAAACSQTQE